MSNSVSVSDLIRFNTCAGFGCIGIELQKLQGLVGPHLQGLAAMLQSLQRLWYIWHPSTDFAELEVSHIRLKAVPTAIQVVAV